jgi:hypothetical protein
MPQNIVDASTVSTSPQFNFSIRRSNGLANNLLYSTADYAFDMSANSHYDPRVRDEIAHGIRDMRALLSRPKSGLVALASLVGTRDKAINADDPIVRDQAVWTLANRKRADIDALQLSIQKAPTESLAVSAMLALQSCADQEFDKVYSFFHQMAATSSSVNLAEWATVISRELLACKELNLDLLQEPASKRDSVHLPEKTFDLTMPLIFQCNARTTVGGVGYQLSISPTWFKQIFGDAMACIRHETFQSGLVLEKNVGGLHADGSAHYEHFPFHGTTTQLNSSLHLHNYWAQIFRPYYTSGRVEVVTAGHDVMQQVPMSFSRVAITAAYDKYAVNGVPMPETVRGIFFGYGHIPPRTLITRGLKLRAGDFQISSRLNPASGKPANTCFYGTFFGKLTDTDDSGRLTLNGRDTHCDPEGHLDYHGQGSMDKDPVRPHDWC